MNRSVRIRNIPKGISNEYAAEAFSRFGDVKDALVFESGEGKIVFKDEIGARQCIHLLEKHAFYLGRSMMPVTAELEVTDLIGTPEKSLLDFDPEVQNERSIPPYFAQSAMQLQFQKEWLSHFQAEKETKINYDRILEDERKAIRTSHEKRATEALMRKHEEMAKTFKKHLDKL